MPRTCLPDKNEEEKWNLYYNVITLRNFRALVETPKDQITSPQIPTDPYIPFIPLSRSSNRLIRRRNRPPNIDLLHAPGSMEFKVRLSGVHANTLLAKEVDEQRARLVVALGESGLVVLVLLDVLDVLVEEIRRVHWSTLGFGVELRAEDGAGVVDQALVGLVVEVGEVLPPFAAEGGGVDGVAVVLGCDVALPRGEVERWDVMGSVAVLELDGLGSGSEGNELVAHAYAHDGDLGGVEQLAEVVHG